jgi:flavin-dependent thymidylate synthase
MTQQRSAEVSKWADPAMFAAIPLTEEGKAVEPSVTVVNMTHNPLRVMAAAAQLYRGIPVHDPREIDRQLALDWLASVSQNRLQAALEFIDIHLFLRGVSRAFTHQLVRQRTAVFIQESLRFAVKEGAAWEVMMPPEISALREDDPRRVIWRRAVEDMSGAYNSLINSGVPAEDARGLLPTNIMTSVHYKTNLRNLADHSYNRLCSQAQHEWKQIWALIIQAILNYGPTENRWQQKAICGLFKPICFASGRCEFNSPDDRYCVIRDRVEAHHKAGDPVSTWTDIDPREPLHYLAARKPV